MTYYPAAMPALASDDYRYRKDHFIICNDLVRPIKYNKSTVISYPCQLHFVIDISLIFLHLLFVLLHCYSCK